MTTASGVPGVVRAKTGARTADTHRGRTVGGMTEGAPTIQVTPNEALVYIDAWRHAVQLQALRILSSGTGMPDGPVSKQVDSYLFVVALRDFLRAVDLAKRLVSEESGRDLESAIGTFDAAVPSIRALRNVLEHFDSYAQGTGYIQDSNRKRTGRPPFPVAEWTERGVGTYRLVLGVNGRTLSIEVKSAADACAVLASRTVDALIRTLE